MKDAVGSSSPIEFVPYSDVFDSSFEDMPRRVPDITKIGRFIGYRPTVHLPQIIDRVAEYWRPGADAAPAAMHAMPRVAAVAAV